MRKRVELVRTANLRIDPSYQRPRKEAWIQAQRKVGWREELAEVISVADRDGTRNGAMYVFEGQQRLHLARELGIAHIWAAVYEGFSPAEESAGFSGINGTRVRTTYYERFRARLNYGEALAERVRKVVEDEGLVLDLDGRTGSNSSASALRAIAAVEKLVKVDPKIATATLHVLTEAWESSDRLHTRLIQAVGGMVYVYRQHPHFQTPHLVRSLQRETPVGVIGRIRSLSDALDAGVGSGDHRTRPGDRAALLSIYNRGLKRRLPEASQSDLKRIAIGQNPWA